MTDALFAGLGCGFFMPLLYAGPQTMSNIVVDNKPRSRLICKHEIENPGSEIHGPGSKFMAHPDDNTKDDLIRRGDVIAEIKRIADDHAAMALFGETEQARIREGMEAALRRAQYAVAFMPKAE
jgi:hypothetical protein